MADRTKERILNTALKLFSQKGYLGATTKEIAKEAKIAEVTLFRYFPSKEVLFEEVINTYSFLPTLKEILEKVKKEPCEKALKTIAHEFIKVLESKKDLIKIMHSEMHRYPEEIKKIHENIIENTITVLSEYFKKLQRRKILREINTVFAARAFLGMFFSYFYGKEIKECLNLKKEDTKEVIDTYVDIFLKGVLKV
ncbi:MAG: TetR/AcrR family transcriptional regulator [Thermodesulfobacterium geofontis]|uniref:TetR/AcrR family transcriptional regulator n=1 Tax=Thermodesulfobacterium geofontis TaxID=1295609 RepID=A0A2N7Q674_9BACT|nr:MAG: TetR/AcrR family transcriptional regulator [Thermodesulfobacterium geofontis]